MSENLKKHDEQIKLEPEKKMNRKRYILIKIIYKTALIFLGYAISYFHGSLILLVIAAASLIWLENRDKSNQTKIHTRAIACSYSKQDLIKKIDEIPSWVKFPDRERAEWLNQVIEQLWPTVNSYIIRLFRNSLQNKIRKKYDSFQFESLDFGKIPPKIDGIKVYNTSHTKDSIIIDFDVFYDGDCDINFSISGAEIGGLRDFQLSVEVRIVLKPLLLKMPLIGGIQIYFLNTPDINFTLDGLSGIPGLSTFLRTKILEKITKLIVFPNKFTKRFSKSIAPSELKALEPTGVLRIHVFEAKDLMGKDITGKSDPYVILYVGAQEKKTNFINQTLNPKWDYWCEFVILDPLSQHLGFKVFDRDNVNEDDFLGSGEIAISNIIGGNTDQWIKLENAKHGSIHMRFTWLTLSADLSNLDAIREETQLLKVTNISRAILIVYIEMARNLPCAKNLIKPQPFFYLIVGEQKEKSRVKKHTNDPNWDQGFVFLVQKPLQDFLEMTVLDKLTGNILNQFFYKISDLLQEPNLEISKKEFSMINNETKIILSLQLRILTNELFELDDESETDSDLESLIDSPLIQLRDKKDVEEKIFSTTVPDVAVAPPINSMGKYGLGRLEISLVYNEPRQKLLITVHQIVNLPLKDPNDIPDPYVRIKMLSQNQTSGPTYRTRVIMDCCNPVYEETFEYLFSLTDAYEQTAIATVKTKKFLHNNTIGQVKINLKYVNLSEAYRAWFDICPKTT